jgi:hypothetical protein
MDKNMEDDMFAEVYYQGTVKRLKEVADSRVNWQAYMLTTHLHRILRNPILSSKTKKALGLKMKTFERYVMNNKKNTKKELSVCTLSKIMEDIKSILGENVFDVRSTEMVLCNLQKMPQIPTPMSTDEDENENENENEREHVQCEEVDGYQYSPLSPDLNQIEIQHDA